MDIKSEVATFGPETKMTNNNAQVRRELAGQLMACKYPNHKLIDLLNLSQHNFNPVLVFSLGIKENLAVSLANEETTNAFLKHIKEELPKINTEHAGRLLAKKINHFKSPKVPLGLRSKFKGIKPTQEAAERLITEIMENGKTIIVRDRTFDIFNSSGMGIRINIETGSWVLQGFNDSASYIRPDNLRN